MSFLDPQCEHEREGHVLAASYRTAMESVHVLAMPGAGFRLEGLTASQWEDVANSYAGQMLDNNAAHEKGCEQ